MSPFVRRLSMGQEQRTEQKLDQALAQVADISEAFESYPELKLILGKLIAKAEKEGAKIFRTKNLDLAIRNAREFDDFINGIINGFTYFLKREHEDMAGISDEQLKKALRLTCYLAFVGHFGVERREEGIRGGQMDYFIHPIFAAFFELVYRVEFPKWEMEGADGVENFHQTIGVAIAEILHDLFEDFKKGKLIKEIAEGIDPSKVLEAFREIIKVDIPQALEVSGDSQVMYGDMLVGLIEGVTNPEGAGRLQSALHFLSRISDSIHGKAILAVKMGDRMQNGNTIGSGPDAMKVIRIIEETKAIFLSLLGRTGNLVALANLQQVLAIKPKTATAYYRRLVGGGGEGDIEGLMGNVQYQIIDALPKTIGRRDLSPEARLYALVSPDTYPTKREAKAGIRMIGGIAKASASDLIPHGSPNRAEIRNRQPSELFREILAINGRGIPKGKIEAHNVQVGHRYERQHEADIVLAESMEEVERILLGDYGKRTSGRVDLGAFNPNDHLEEAKRLDDGIRKNPKDESVHNAILGFLERLEQALTDQ